MVADAIRSTTLWVELCIPGSGLVLGLIPPNISIMKNRSLFKL